MEATAATPKRRNWLLDLCTRHSRPVSERIVDIAARHQDEWVGIGVTKMDQRRNPLRGVLIAHSHDHDEVVAAIRGRKGCVMVVYNGNPEGEVILSVGLPVQS